MLIINLDLSSHNEMVPQGIKLRLTCQCYGQRGLNNSSIILQIWLPCMSGSSVSPRICSLGELTHKNGRRTPGVKPCSEWKFRICFALHQELAGKIPAGKWELFGVGYAAHMALAVSWAAELNLWNEFPGWISHWISINVLKHCLKFAFLSQAGLSLCPSVSFYFHSTHHYSI